MMKIVHIILPATCNYIPVAAFGYTIAVGIGHVSGSDSAGSGNIVGANSFPPGGIGIGIASCSPGIPGIIRDFGASVKIAGHVEMMIPGKGHECLCFGLPCKSVGMVTIEWIFIIAIEIDIAQIVSARVSNCRSHR